MCGISGFLQSERSFSNDETRNIVQSMASVIAHRGPDDKGVWVDEAGNMALSHRRLSILDLSPEGHQPMLSRNERYVIAYNGEVYNYRDIRKKLQLDGYSFRSDSDTEVVLQALEAWGVETALEEFIGMFAFALWDRKEKTLVLVRDRLGKKPLYYGWVGKSFVFSSELSSFRVFPGFNNQINRDSVALMMRHNCIPAPYSVYQDVYKLMPGDYLTIDTASFREPKVLSYWSAKKMVETSKANAFEGSDEDAINELNSLIDNAVGQRMIADVPLGAFLSGGYDSTLVVANMQAQSNTPVKTFSIGFNDENYNEAHHAKRVATYLNTDHTEMYLSADEVMSVIPDLPTFYDEPFSDSSQIPTILVSKMAKQYVSVCLSGDGGDEMFGGYNRYFWGDNIWNKVGSTPHYLRGGVSKAVLGVSKNSWDNLFSMIDYFIPRKYRFSLPGDKLHKFATVLNAKTQDELYKILVSHWQDPTSLVLGSNEPPTILTDVKRKASLLNFSERMMFADLVSYLPDDILTKVDRASMGVSLEARVPLLDHRIVEFAWRLPIDMKIRGGQGKWILRKTLDRYVPRDIMDRPKMGFSIPLGDWLRGSLRPWAEALLDEIKLADEGYFDAALVQNKWKEHLAGSKDWSACLWDVLMFQAWLENSK